jgi:adenylate cyclase
VVHLVDVLADPEYTLTEIQDAGGYRTVPRCSDAQAGRADRRDRRRRREVRPFEEVEIRLVETFAEHAVVAIENVRLFQTVERQQTELARFAPHVANLISSEEGEQLLAGHRREITALLCDLRGFTSFAETAEPEEGPSGVS